MSKYTEGELLAEGKTKCIIEVVENPNLVIIENKNEITAFDDPAFTQCFETKAQSATTTTSRVFEMLHRAGIETAFIEQIAEDKFVMKRCHMLPLEVVGRVFAEGSFCDRNPAFTKGAHIPLAPPVVEFFLKTTKGKLVINGKTIIEGLDWEVKKEEDPLIINPFEIAGGWALFHPKKPMTDPEANLHRIVLPHDVLTPYSNQRRPLYMMRDMHDKLLRVLVALKNGFRRVGINFEDFKMEFGIDPITGEIIPGDVIDNDSWRIADEEWIEYSKQRYRDGRDDIAVIEELYKTVAELVSRPKFLGEIT